MNRVESVYHSIFFDQRVQRPSAQRCRTRRMVITVYGWRKESFFLRTLNGVETPERGAEVGRYNPRSGRGPGSLGGETHAAGTGGRPCLVNEWGTVHLFRQCSQGAAPWNLPMAERRLEVSASTSERDIVSVRVGGHEVMPTPPARSGKPTSCSPASGALKTVSFSQHFRFRA